MLLDNAIVNIELIELKVPEETLNLNMITMDNKNKVIMKFFLVQGKGGELCLVKVAKDMSSIEQLFKIRLEIPHAFMKIPLNNCYYQYDSEAKSYKKVQRVYEDFNEIMVYCPNEETKTIDILQISQKILKIGVINLDMISERQMMCLSLVKYFEIRNGERSQKYIYLAEETGDVQLAEIQFTDLKYKVGKTFSKKVWTNEVFLYDADILVEIEDKKERLKIFNATSLESMLVLTLFLDDLKLHSKTEANLSSKTKPGINLAMIRRCGKYMLVSTCDYKIKLVKLKTMTVVATFSVHEKYINKMLLVSGKEGKEALISCSDDKDLRVLQLDLLKTSKES